MYGLKIDLLMDTKENSNAVNNDLRLNVPHLIWSSYDRINIRKINRFEDFFVFDDDVVKWTGSIQSLHLVSNDFSDCHRILARDNITLNDLLYDTFSKNERFSLSIIISMKINKKIFYKNDIKKNKPLIIFLQNIAKEIAPDCPFECFFSLGEEDIVAIALGNSIDKFMELVKAIRSAFFIDSNGKKTNVCNLTNSFLIQNCIEHINSIECDKSYANLYVALKDGVSSEDFVQKFFQYANIDTKDINSFEHVTMMAGEYDVVLKLSTSVFGNSLFDLYSEKNYSNNYETSLNANSKFYGDFINNSKTIWCYKLSDPNSSLNFEKEFSVNTYIDEFAYNESPKEADKLIKNLLHELNDKVRTDDKNLKYAYHNVIYFLKDASSTLHSTNNEQWKHIISEQIITFIDLYKEFSFYFDENKNLDKYITDLNDVINDMRNSLNHINRSNELFYHIPSSSLHYSGSFNSILIAYYNFINKLLNFAFRKPHNNTKQAKIVFFVYFGMTSKIQEKTYFKNSLKPDEPKLVGFELPYTALYDLKKYFISLTHEVYHLVAPYDRERRNKLILTLWNELFLKKELLSIAQKDLHISSNSEEFQQLNILVDKYFENIDDFFTIKNYKLLSIKALNKQISDVLDNENYNKKFETLYYDFFQFCIELKNEDENFKNLYTLMSNKILYFNTVTKDFGYDYDLVLNIYSLVNNIAESICDTFMYLLSFSSSKCSYSDFIKYLIDFFNEKNINYNDNLDAKYRLFLFILYNELSDNNGNIDIDIEDELFSELQTIFLKYFEYFEDQHLQLIKNIIKEDNFLYSIKHCFSNDEFNKICNEKSKIESSYILPLSENANFESYINVIYSLNETFNIPTYSESKIVTTYDDFALINNLDNDFVGSRYIPSEYIETLDDYFSAIREIRRENPSDEIWYRGMCNYSYNLIPSIYFTLPKNKIPYLYQVESIRQCYVGTKKYYKTFLEHEKPYAVRLSLMQHYGIPTNLLDFSTDPLSSLFWALNPEAGYDREQVQTAAVYFFNTNKYCEAVDYIKRTLIPKNNIDKGLYDEYIGLHKGIYSYNCLSDEYIIEKTTDKIVNSKIRQFNSELNDKINFIPNMYKRLPVPVVIPQKNDRINAQSGTFLAYNLLSLPKDNNYYCYSLQNIQKKFIELKKKKNEDYDSGLFLTRVLISPSYIDSIKINFGDTFKYSIRQIYPDLPNLFKEIKENIKKNNGID